MNDWDPGFSENELVDLVVSVASGEMSKAAVVSAFQGHCRPSDSLLA
jgi:hypothetical protein